MNSKKTTENDIFIEVLSNISSTPPREKFNFENIEINIFNEVNVKTNKFLSSSFEHVSDTLKFILDKYGKGIYIKIVDNKVENFIPFENDNYINYWQIEYVNGFKKGFINFDLFENGILDDYVIRNYDEYYDVFWLNDIFNILCKNRIIKDCEFFINYVRNLPIITFDRSIADKNIYKIPAIDLDMPLTPHTVFSFNTSSEFRDSCIPTIVDYKRVVNNTFGIENFKSMKWDDKEFEFLFRGNSTTYGIYVDKEPINIKLLLVEKLRQISSKHNIPVNVGISNFEKVPIVEHTETYTKIHFIEENKKYLPDKDFTLVSKSKFIFCVDEIGHPEEMSTILFSGSCILRVQSKWSSWFDDFLLPYKHYVPIDKDLKNLESSIIWCQENEILCKNIGLNARQFACKYLSKNGILDYLQLQLNSINFINYNVSLYSIQTNYQKTFLQDYFSIEELPPLGFTVDFSVLTVNYSYRLSYESLAALQLLYLNNGMCLIPTTSKSKIILSKGCSDNPEISLSYVKTYELDNFDDGINNTFIGIRCMNTLRQEIPNFAFTFCCEFLENNNKSYLLVFQENIINAVTIDEFLNRYPSLIYEISIQLFLSLQVAYERFCFQHGKLDCDKILIQTLPSPIKLTYVLSDRVFSLKTKYLVTIVNFSYSKVLSNFEIFNKTKRMFIGNYDELKSKNIACSENESDFSKIFHVKGDSDSKYLFKKLLGKRIGEKVYNKIKFDKNYSEPINLMKETITTSDIKSNDIKFGTSQLEEPIPENPRLIYDKMTNESTHTTPHNEVVSRIFKNPIPTEISPLENIVMQYEITQCLKSTFLDLKMKFSMDLITSERIQRCLDFVKKYYEDVIVKQLDETFSLDDSVNNYKMDQNVDLWNIKMIIRKYFYPLVNNKHYQKISKQIVYIMAFTLKQSITYGIKNSLDFYQKYRREIN